ANRIGHTALTLPQLKIIQEAIALGVFVPFSIIVMKEGVSWNYLWAALCIAGAVYFIFRGA
ncbi:MAG: DMT family protein, partial [Victivallaceae bacterium]|nr:DMT family protein [Victivallaceae bacterium]